MAKWLTSVSFVVAKNGDCDRPCGARKRAESSTSASTESPSPSPKRVPRGQERRVLARRDTMMSYLPRASHEYRSVRPSLETCGSSSLSAVLQLRLIRPSGGLTSEPPEGGRR